MAYMDVPPSGTPNGRSVVLLHGMNFFGEAWTETIAILSKEGYRVVVPDQIGYGRSSKPILHYSISTHASNTKRLIDALGIKTTDIVTHSMGGMVASRFASSYPDAVGSLAMINQIGLTDARSAAAVARHVRGVQGGARARLRRDRRGHARVLRELEARVHEVREDSLRLDHERRLAAHGDGPRAAAAGDLRRPGRLRLAADQGADARDRR